MSECTPPLGSQFIQFELFDVSSTGRYLGLRKPGVFVSVDTPGGHEAKADA